MAKTVEYRVRPVTRYVVTAFTSDPETKVGSVETIGEFQNEDLALRVKAALERPEPKNASNHTRETGNWLDSRLREIGKTQAGLARALSLSPDKVNRIAKGIREVQVNELPVMARYLEWSVEELVTGLDRGRVPPNRLRDLREKAGLSQEKVATAAGMVQQQLDKLEKGQRRLKDYQIHALAEALGVSPADIL